MEPGYREVAVRDVRFGADVVVVRPVNLYECEIGDGSFIGPFVEIQRGAKIGKRSRIQSHAFVCELVSIGDDCFISHGVMFINDLFTSGSPAGGDPTKWRSTVIGDRVSIGTNATILPVSICDNVVIGAGSVVTKSIDTPGTYCGNPAKLQRAF